MSLLSCAACCRGTQTSLSLGVLGPAASGTAPVVGLRAKLNIHNAPICAGVNPGIILAPAPHAHFITAFHQSLREMHSGSCIAL